MSVRQPVFRFAPSPNGELHLGHALSAIVSYEMAQRTGGRFLVRIEDIDVERCHEEFVAQVFEDLAWLGTAWEEPVVRQSANFGAYRAAAARLEAMGLLYPCFATRTEIADAARALPDARDPDGASLYPGLYRGLDKAEAERRCDSGEPFALRIDMERALRAASDILAGRRLTFSEIDSAGRPKEIEASPERWGDAVIVRKDVPASYHLAVVVDDAAQGVTHVTRGQDLLPATGLHRLLQVLLGLEEPLYHHHRLVTDANGRKLAKSERDTSLRALRARGASSEEIRAMIGF
jgi:glutamyl-Q tRNA(Asp) synthetase